MSSGYSKTPLIKKLGIKPSFKIHIINAPENYFGLLGGLPDNVEIVDLKTGELDLIHCFFLQAKDLQDMLPSLHKALKPNGMIWISWAKKASKIETDLNRDVIREMGLAQGLVDVKVGSIDDTWSGLKFVIPVANR
ncbi:MAG: DUF3052 domain-containing protein [Chloroflexota bacterium]